MNLKEKAYHFLPVFAQNILVSLFGLYWYRRRFSGAFRKFYSEALLRDNYSWKEWEEYQISEIRRIIKHASEKVPYYSALLLKNGVEVKNIENFGVSDLYKIPILDKSVFKSLGNSEMISSKLQGKGTYIYTSGSTGTPLKILYSGEMHKKYLAIYERSVRNWAGLNFKNSRGVFGGRRILKTGESMGPYHRYNFVEKQVYFSVYHISGDTVQEYVRALIKYEPDYLEGYSSSIYFLSRFIQQANLKAPKLKAVLGSTDKMSEEMRRVISETFDCQVFDSYNGVDLCNLISECEEHSLHIVPDVGFVEVRNDKGEICKPGEIGELISTGFLNFDQPLIRYRIGDLVKLSENQNCKCGRGMVVIDEIIGRVEDAVIGSDGRRMRRFNRVFVNIDPIVEAQIIQHSVNKIEIKVVLSRELSKKDISTIQDRVKSQLGEIELEITRVGNIPRGPNGKFKAVISHVSRPEVG